MRRNPVSTRAGRGGALNGRRRAALLRERFDMIPEPVRDARAHHARRRAKRAEQPRSWIHVI